MSDKDYRGDWKMKVVILNGPPNSGKDVGAEHLSKVFEGYHKEFKGILFKATKAAFGLTDDVWGILYKRESKELPSTYLIHNGEYISPRTAMINTSENVIKPLFGQDAFGKALANDLEDGINFVSDGGFASEVKPISDMVGPENVLILRIRREGCTFQGDSRRELSYNDVEKGITIEDVNNVGDLCEYLDKLESKVKDWLR